MPSNNYILAPDGNIYSEDELYHYGVIGMKWGKRKADYYTGKANARTSKMKTSKTLLGKNFQNYMAYRNETKANVKKSMSEKGIRKTIDNVYGHGGLASQQKAASKFYDRRASYAKTRLGKTMYKSKAHNAKTAAAANERLHNSKGIKKIQNYVDSMANRSIKTWSGRTTTTGKQMIDNMLTLGIAGTIADIKYYRDHRK